MKIILSLLFSLFVTNIGLSEEKPTAPSIEWLGSYYKSPSPDSFSKQVMIMADNGLLENRNAHAVITAFLSQIMVANPDRISGWIKETIDLSPIQRAPLFSAAWYSNTKEARALFKELKMDDYLEERAPNILEMELISPTSLDMLWAYFMATGDPAPIRRIVSALSLSKYSGSMERFETSKKTKKDEKLANLDLTFQAAQWSIESNSKKHPLVFEYCEKILADKTTPKDQALWLGVILSKIKPE